MIAVTGHAGGVPEDNGRRKDAIIIIIIIIMTLAGKRGRGRGGEREREWCDLRENGAVLLLR